jgi:hypothetical protein
LNQPADRLTPAERERVADLRLGSIGSKAKALGVTIHQLDRIVGVWRAGRARPETIARVRASLAALDAGELPADVERAASDLLLTLARRYDRLDPVYQLAALDRVRARLAARAA